MADVDSLPPDQRAALQLLLKQGQSYDQIADLLGIEPDSVRDRAHAALESLGPDVGRRLEGVERADISDYLLGQQAVSEREGTRSLLGESAAARAWARGVAGELQSLAPDALPEIPEDREPDPEPEALPEPDASDEPAGYERAAREPGERPASRLGGALLLGGIGLIIAVVLILVLSSGGDDNKNKSDVGSISRTAPTTSTGQGTNPQLTPTAQVNLVSPQGGDKTLGLVSVFASGSQRAIIVRAQGLQPGAYALWLYNSESGSKLLGFVPNKVGKDGSFQTQGVLPNDASKYKQVVVTKEAITQNTRTAPKQPGAIVLQGDLKLG